MITAIRPVTIKQGDEFSIVILSDLHIGSSLFARDEFIFTTNYIKKLAKEKQVIVILGGDLVEAITSNDKRFSWGQVDPTYPRENSEFLPQVQCEDAKGLLMPIREQIEFTVEGNHCEKVTKTTKAINPQQYLIDNCFKSGVQFLGYSGFIVFPITFTHRENSDNPKVEYNFKMAINHGVGGGMKAGASINSLYDLLDAPSADIIAMGHLHHGINDRNEKYDYHPRRGFYAYQQIVCSVGSFMYKERNGFVGYASKLKGKAYPVSFTQIDIKCGETKDSCTISAYPCFPSEGQFNKITRKL